MFRTLILVSVLLVAAGADTAQHYVNARYGLSSEIPDHADICRVADGGLFFRPAGVTSPSCDDDIDYGERYTSATARWHADHGSHAATFVSSECPEMAYDSRGHVSAMALPAPIGGLKGVACRIDRADGSIAELVLVQRPAALGVPAIDYRFTLKTTPRDHAIDHAAFLRWLGTVRLRRPV